MFFDLARKNSKRSRKENGLFFSSLVLSIIAFYIILSLEKQDVMVFLKTMESDAVRKLLALLPALYIITLCILFFLVYFASKYQMERRNHEFGVYLMMGMKRSKLLFMLLLEDLWSSVVSLLTGIPLAVALSELISLVTARIAGLGIIGHHFTFSVNAAVWTVIGFAGVKLLVSGILSFKTVKKELGELLDDTQEQKLRNINTKKTTMILVGGVILLGIAYAFGILGIAWSNVLFMGLTMAVGICGMLALFDGFGSFMEMLLKKQKQNSKKSQGLHTFTYRQIQENVLNRSRTLAVSSLLILAALCCFGYGISMGGLAAGGEEHVIDFTFDEEQKDVEKVLQAPELNGYVDRVFTVRSGMFFSEKHLEGEYDGKVHDFQPEQLIQSVEKLKNSKEKEILLNNLQYFTSPYLIPQSDYNHILELAGEEPLNLGDDEIALYNDPDMGSKEQNAVIAQALKSRPEIGMDGVKYRLQEKMYTYSIVVDRFITINYGLIVPDERYESLVGYKDSNMSFCNVALREEVVKKDGLMQAIYHVNNVLKDSGLQYESYIQNMGRQLFRTVASSYITIYLAVVFLIIANTMIGVQFLMLQKKMGRRYRTLISMGSNYEAVKHSARVQIKWYFGMPVAAAVLSSVFGLWSLFKGLLSDSMRQHLPMLAGIALTVIILLCVVEYMYITCVMRNSDRHILKMMRIERVE